MLASAARGLNGAPTDLSLRNWTASVHCKEDSLRLRSYLEHQGTKVGPLAVHLEVYRVVDSGGLALLHTANSYPLLGVEGSGDSWHRL